VAQKEVMHFFSALRTPQLAESKPEALASLGPAFDFPQLCWPAGHVPQLALLSATLRPMANDNAMSACLYTPGR